MTESRPCDPVKVTQDLMEGVLGNHSVDKYKAIEFAVKIERHGGMQTNVRLES